jgi:hypothetical protein
MLLTQAFAQKFSTFVDLDWLEKAVQFNSHQYALVDVAENNGLGGWWLILQAKSIFRFEIPLPLSHFTGLIQNFQA